MPSTLISREGWEPALSLAVNEILEHIRPGVVFLGRADGDSYRVVGAWGEYAEVFDNAVLPLAMTHCKTVIETQRPVRIADATVRDLHKRPEHVQAHPCKSYLGVPLNVNGVSDHYTLAVACADPHEYTDEDEALLLAMANLLVTHAERGLLRQRLEQQGLRLHLLLDIGLATAGGVRGVADSVCQGCASLFDVAMVRVVRVDHEPAELLASIVPPRCEQTCDLANPDLGPEMTVKRVGQVRMMEFSPGRNKECECWRDDGPLGFLGLPVFDALGKVVAVLSLIDAHPRSYDESELNLLKVFAEKLSAEWTRDQIERKVSVAEAQAGRRAMHLEILLNIWEEVRTGVQFNMLALDTMNRCLEWLSLRHGAMYFGMDGAWILVGQSGFRERFGTLGGYVPMSQVDWNLARKPVVNCRLDDPLAEAFREDGIKSWLLMPLLEHESVLGGFILASQQESFFDGDLVAMATGVSEQLSAALMQSKLSRDIAEQAADLTTVISSLSDALVEVTADRTVLQVNQAAQRLLGMNQGPSGADEWHELMPLYDAQTGEPAGENHPVARAFNEDRTFPATHWRLEREGQTTWVSVTAAPIADAETGNVRAVVVAMRDVSEQRAMDQKVLSAEKYASVARLAAGVAHEFKNYLAGIMGNASLAKEAARDNDRVGTMLQRVLDICARANQTALSLLSYVRDADCDRQVIDLASLIGEVSCLVDQQATKRHVHIESDCQPQVCAVIVAAQIRQVFLAILTNALEAMPDGGTLTVQTRTERKQAIVRVIDTGVGISPENLPSVFDPFFSTKGVWGGQDGAGTGLGLTSSLNFVREHGGDIRIESRKGEGTTVTVALPLASPEQIGVPMIPAAAGDRRALVMEFDPTLRGVLTEKLEESGWKVITCNKAAHLEKTLDGEVVIAFLDALMPGKINFIRAFEYLRESCPHGRIFVTTSDATDYQLADYIRSAAGRIVKPASADKVSAFLEVHLSSLEVPS